jgi:hypothetical protein
MSSCTCHYSAVCCQAQNWEDAATGYKGALKEDPNHKVWVVQFNLKICEAYKNLNQGAKAITACDAVMAADNRNVEALLLRSDAKKLEEDFQGCLNDVQEASRYRENDRAIQQKIHEVDGPVRHAAYS